jgi:hypothetical protein
MEGLIRAAFKKKAWQAELERLCRDREEQERRRAEEAAMREAEEKRIKQWDEWMNAWEKAQDVRAFVVAMRETLTPVDVDSKIDGWLIWAEQYAQRIDPLVRWSR